MDQVFDEGRLRFSFSGDWRVLRWDKHPAYERGLRRVTETKAVDFIGHHRGTVWFIEVKDFRGYATENKARLGQPLADEVADKVRDTIAGLTWACEREEVDREHDLSGWLQPILRREPGARLPLVLWLEPGRPLDELHRSVLTDQIKRRLSWAGVAPLILEMSRCEPGAIPGLVVTSAPHLPAAR